MEGQGKTRPDHSEDQGSRSYILKDVEYGYLIKKPGQILNQEIKNHFVLSVIKIRLRY